ncbi:NAD(P)/FAD-dependent oxidoreductase [Rhodoligotrophos defluvii]|uniref:NAD(P)/FAD-dependent oxidoreductase n=1 Tax=Rhodoligotrophos defluvii TaxID=2561934 RepID=UPI001EF061B5|nr:FAD-dependent oxidoreductase [Rhodoligotrophos defluvii]
MTGVSEAGSLARSNAAIVVGGGQAGVECATSLRQNGWPGEIIVIAAEELPPYQRPPLSKAFLAGEMPVERLFLRAAGFYEAERIQLRLGESVTAIDRRDNAVVTSEGTVLHYAKLFLATGARPRSLAVPGAHLEGVGFIRSAEDSRRLQPLFTAGSNLVIVGGGYIGLEVAAVARKKGLSVTVVEAGPRLLGRVTAPVVSSFYEQFHRTKGVDIRLGATVSAFTGERRVRTAVLADGSELPCDLAVVGIGIVPNDEIAMYAGVEVEPGEGVVVDRAMRTSDPDIYAMGDCAFALNDCAGRRGRIESVANAIEQARIAAAHACGVEPPSPAVPWFWSDQYDLKLQTAGLISRGYDRAVVRGDPATGKFAVFYFSDTVLVALDAINSPAEFNIAKRIIARGGAGLDPERAADLGLDARQLLPA